MKNLLIILILISILFLSNQNNPIYAATCNSTLGWDYIEGAEGYGIVGEETDLWGTINITPDQGIVKGLFYDGETWVDATSTIRSYESWANMNIKKTYDVASDYAIATYWILDDGSSLYCSNTIGVFYLNSIPYNNPTLTYNATSFPNRASMDIYLTGSHSYIRMVEFGISGIVGENKAVPVSPNTYWEIKLNDVRKELFGIIGIGTFTIDASDIGDWYRMAFNDLEQVKITYLSPNFNAGEGSGSNATFYSSWGGGVIKIYSRDNNSVTPTPPPPPSTPCTSVSGYVRQIGTNEGIYGAQVTPQRYLDSVLYGCTTATTNLTGYWSSYCNGDMDILRVIKNASLPTGCVAATTLATAPPGFNCDSPDIGYNHIFCTKNASWTTSCGPFTFWVDCDENYVAPSPTPTPTPTPAPCPVCSSITTEVGASYGLNNNYKIDGYVYFTPTLAGYDAGTRAYVDRVDINAFTSAARTVTCKITDASGNNDQGLIEATSPTFVSQSWVPITFAAGNQYTVTLGQAARLFCHGPASEAYTTIQWFYNNVLQGAVPPNGNGGNHIIRCCPIEPVINAPWFQTIAGSVIALGSTGIRSNIPYHDASGPCIAANSCKPALISSLPYVYTAAAQNTPGFALSKYGAITTHQDSANQTTLIHDAERSQTLDGYALDASLRVRLQNYDHFIKKFAPNDLVVLNSSTMPSLQTDNLNLFIYDGDLSINDTHNWHVEDGQQVIVFVNGNLTINALNNFEGNVISVEEGSFLAFIVKQNITIGKEVGYTLANGLTAGEYLPSTTTPNLEGVFVADQLLISESYNDTAIVDKKLIAAGTFVGWAGVNLNRDFNDEALGLEHNSYNPTETFIYRPDLVTNMPEEIKSFHQMWQEVAPRRLDSN